MRTRKSVSQDKILQLWFFGSKRIYSIALTEIFPKQKKNSNALVLTYTCHDWPSAPLIYQWQRLGEVQSNLLRFQRRLQWSVWMCCRVRALHTGIHATQPTIYRRNAHPTSFTSPSLGKPSKLPRTNDWRLNAQFSFERQASQRRCHDLTSPLPPASGGVRPKQNNVIIGVLAAEWTKL